MTGFEFLDPWRYHEASEEDEMDESLLEYRNHLVLAEQKAQEDYDKAVIALSGGAFGVSFAFVEKIVPVGGMVCSSLLLAAWTCWAISLLVVVGTFFTSHLALQRAIRQVDDGTIHDQRAGGIGAFVTRILNAVGGLLFVAGLLLLIFFVKKNLGG